MTSAQNWPKTTMAPILFPLTGRWATEVESLQSSHFSTGLPTWGTTELSNCKSTPIYKPESQFFFHTFGRFFHVLRCRTSFWCKTRFASYATSQWALEYYRAHCFIILFSFYVQVCLHFILQVSLRAVNLLAFKTKSIFFYLLGFKIKMTVKCNWGSKTWTYLTVNNNSFPWIEIR